MHKEWGDCAKRVVTCTLVTPDAEMIVGKNWCANPQDVCPREEGEDYSKCTTICQQIGHAEVVAVWLAKEKAKGAHAFLQNHTYACRHCQETLFEAGVRALTIGQEPEY